MRLHDTPATTPRERELRRLVHARAIIKGVTMRQAVFEALELWLRKEESYDTGSDHKTK